MKSTKFWAIALVGLLASSLLIGCGSKVVIGEEIVENDTIDPQEQDTVTTPIIEGVNNIKVYFDNSGSMSGYVSANAHKTSQVLLNALTGIYQDFGQGKKPLTVEFCCKVKGKKLDDMNYAKFRDAVQTGKVQSGSESLLNVIMDTIASNVKPNQLSILLTDGILSGPADKIFKNSEYTPNNIEELKSDLRNALSGKGLAASIYRFGNAGFDGVYWDYTNNTKSLTKNHRVNKSTRPLYAVVIGKPDEVKIFKEWAESPKNKNFNYSNVAHAIAPLPISTGLETQTPTMEGDSALTYKYADLKNKLGNKIEFRISTDIFADYLQPDSASIDKITKRIAVTFDGWKRTGWVSSDANEIVITIPDSSLQKGTASLIVEIPYEQPEWIGYYSTNDDRGAVTSDTTFMLDKFAGAILEGVSGSENVDNLFQQTIKITGK